MIKKKGEIEQINSRFEEGKFKESRSIILFIPANYSLAPRECFNSLWNLLHLRL